MKKSQMVSYAAYFLVNAAVMYPIYVGTTGAARFYSSLDVELPAITILALRAGWAIPIIAMIVGVLGIVTAAKTALSEEVLANGLLISSFLEILLLGGMLFSLIFPLYKGFFFGHSV